MPLIGQRLAILISLTGGEAHKRRLHGYRQPSFDYLALHRQPPVSDGVCDGQMGDPYRLLKRTFPSFLEASDVADWADRLAITAISSRTAKLPNNLVTGIQDFTYIDASPVRLS